MTDLDSPRRNNDCYFYYYSTCAKGDSCTFRHEPSALGCETMCSFWKEGKCLNVHCNFRHMELRKNRKAIQCYWETQPGGCLKPHCPFLHQSVKPLNAYNDNKIGSNTEPTQTIKNDIGQASDKGFKNPVDPLVVNFEEESDTESAISLSPIKNQNKRVKVKTLEEIKLEKIQEESAAYFSYEGDHHANASIEDDLRSRLLLKMRQKKLAQDDNEEHPIKKIKLTISDNVSLDDRIKILAGKQTVIEQPKNPENFSLDEHIHHKRKRKLGSVLREDKDSGSFKIKTLAEIRAERMRKLEESDMSKKKRTCTTESENEVSSTSKDEVETTHKEQPRKRLKLRRLSSEKVEVNDFNSNINEGVNLPLQESGEDQKSLPDNRVLDSNELQIETTANNENEPKIDINIEENSIDSQNQGETNSNGSDSFPNKLTEEVLLLDDDDDYSNVTLKAEDELLGEIDDILGS